MKVISINVTLKGYNTIDLVLYKKIYSTPNGIIEHWSTDIESKFRLNAIIEDKDVIVDAFKITKDLEIITSESEIADKLTAKLLNTRVKQLQNV